MRWKRVRNAFRVEAVHRQHARAMQTRGSLLPKAPLDLKCTISNKCQLEPLTNAPRIVSQ